MNERETAMIPYFAHEGEMSRAERANKRLWIIIIILIIALVGTNAGWIIYESQFSEVATETTVDQHVDTGDGTAVVSGMGDAVYGEGSSTGNNQEEIPGE